MSKKTDWVSIKDSYPPNQSEVEVRTNSKDRHPRMCRWDQGFKMFYDNENKEISAGEWRMIRGKTPITEEEAILMGSIDDKPEGATQDFLNSNEYFITFEKDDIKYVYSYTDSECKSPWHE